MIPGPAHKANRYLQSKFLLIFAFITLSVSGYTQDRPKVGLVLSGGAAKGIAHIGVLKVLEEAGMPIDYIGGTSMGSIVGGLYALGYSADSLEALVKSLDWDYLLTDDISRKQLYINEKEDKDRFMVSVPFGKKGIRLPMGVIRGQHIENMLARLTVPAYRIKNFDSLPVPFLCVSLNVDKGRDTVFRSGNLATAMRASMSIPSVFEPVIIHGDRFVDGGVADNFPVDYVRQMGADIIIGIDVGFIRDDSIKKENLLQLMEDALLYPTLSKNRENRKKVDIYIQPDLKGLGVTSFHDADSLIAYGEEAARSIFPRLKHLADSIRNLRTITPTEYLSRPDSLYVESVHIEGLRNTSGKIISRRLSFSAAQWVTPSEIALNAEVFYNTGLFNKVTFHISEGHNGVIVTYRFIEKEQGQLKLGFYYDNNYKSSVFLNATLYNRLIHNTRFSATVGLGKNPSFEAEYYLDQGPLLAPGIKTEAGMLETWNYDNERNRETSTYYFVGTADLFLQSSISNLLQLRLGSVFNHTTIQPGVGNFDPGTVNDNYIGFFTNLYLDTRNQAWFPQSGHYLKIRSEYFPAGNFPSFYYVRGNYSAAIKLTQRITLIPDLFAGMVSGERIPFPYAFRIGGTTNTTIIGNVPFPGYRFLELSTPTVVIGGVRSNIRIFQDVFLSLNLKGGVRAASLPDIFSRQQFFSGYSTGIGFDSPFGPLKITISKSGEYRQVFMFIQAGYWF